MILFAIIVTLFILALVCAGVAAMTEGYVVGDVFAVLFVVFGCATAVTLFGTIILGVWSVALA